MSKPMFKIAAVGRERVSAIYRVDDHDASCRRDGCNADRSQLLRGKKKRFGPRLHQPAVITEVDATPFENREVKLRCGRAA